MRQQPLVNSMKRGTKRLPARAFAHSSGEGGHWSSTSELLLNQVALLRPISTEAFNRPSAEQGDA
jgi:hypothetical protein